MNILEMFGEGVLDRAGLELLDATVNHLSACLDRLTTECRQIGENLLSFLLDDEPSDCSGLVADSLGTLLRACEVEAGSCERRRQRKLQWLGNLRNRNLMEVNAPPESTPPLLDLSSRFFASFPRPSGCSPLNSCLLTSQPTEGDSQQSVVGSDRPSGISNYTRLSQFTVHTRCLRLYWVNPPRLIAGGWDPSYSPLNPHD